MGKISVFKFVILSVCIAGILGCSEDDNSGASAPHTGNPPLEEEVSPDGDTEPVFNEEQRGELRYVHATRLRVRTSTSLADESNIAGVLDTNDKVLVLSDVLENDMVLIEIVESQADIQDAQEYYTSIKYLSLKPQTARVQHNAEFQYFMVQNIATEKMRIYEKQCGNGACAHKLVFESNTAVGEDKKNDRGLRTIAGNFHINKWIKFYQDGAGRYPSWYKDNYPMPPGPGKSVGSWTKKKVLPYKGASVRGAFGWYTAFPGPDAAYQWTHGTLGWGEDKDKYIKVTRGFWANLFFDPRSHGCTRTDNESIAYVRSLIPKGTPLIKIYAKEAYADPNLSAYGAKSKTWDYILTKNGSQVDGELADRDVVLANGTSRSRYLEEGTYTVDIMPTAEAFSPGKRGAKKGKNGNVYALDDHEMNGVFLVDAGTVINYRHPGQIRVGGYKDLLIPEYMKSKSDSYTLPKD